MNTPIPIPMTADAYLFSISREDSAQALHALRDEISRDDQIAHFQKVQLSDAIDRRFCQLNAQAVGPQKPRWN